MRDYTFRLAGCADIPEIVSLYQSLVGTPGCTWDFEYPNQETAQADIDNQRLYVLTKEAKIVAAASAGDLGELHDLHWLPRHPCELARIGVTPAMQGQGVGSAILQHVIGAAKAKGYDGVIFLVSKKNKAALALYEKNGFEKCGEVFRYNLDFYRYQMQF